MVCFQEMVSESTTKTVLTKLLPNTRYAVTVVPVYAEGDGPSLSDSGKTSEYWLESRAQLLEGEGGRTNKGGAGTEIKI